VLNRPSGDDAGRSAAAGSRRNGESNARRDARVAAEAHAAGPPRAAEHALSAAEDWVGDEGHDLIRQDGTKDE
jgi:hypothetical protein